VLFRLACPKTAKKRAAITNGYILLPDDTKCLNSGRICGKISAEYKMRGRAALFAALFPERGKSAGI
jgi:hypothetical protein